MRGRGVRTIGKNRYNLPSANNRGLARSIHLRRESAGVFTFSHYMPIEFAVKRDTPRASSNTVDIYFDCYDYAYDSRNKIMIIMCVYIYISDKII